MKKVKVELTEIEEMVKEKILNALENNKKKKDKKSIGLHSVYSGMWDYIVSKLNSKEKAKEFMKKLTDNQIIGTRPVNGGYMVYLYSDYKQLNSSSKANEFEKLADE